MAAEGVDGRQLLLHFRVSHYNEPPRAGVAGTGCHHGGLQHHFYVLVGDLGTHNVFTDALSCSDRFVQFHRFTILFHVLPDFLQKGDYNSIILPFRGDEVKEN
jgi:hypothetical protein